MAPQPDPGTDLPHDHEPPGFHLHLDNFDGPFDLLLSLITKRKLDITQVALAEVTSEFIAYIRDAERAAAKGEVWELGATSEFVVVAATLLDLKVARLLPSGTVDDEEDLALLEARDLLFIRLLQYRAFKEVAAVIGERLARQARALPRSVELEPQFAAVLPDLVWSLGPARLAELAAAALAPKPPPPEVSLAHLHAPPVSVREQALIIAERVRLRGRCTFRALVADADSTLVVVARFLALLELFRDALVGFDQPEPLGDLTVEWTGEKGVTAERALSGLLDVSDFDAEPPADPAARAAIRETGAIRAADADIRARRVDDDVVGAGVGVRAGADGGRYERKERS